MNEQTLISKVWNYAHVLRDDGVSYGDYLGQISFLLFLKMDEERTKYLGEPSALPEDCQWDTLRGKSGIALENHYREVLEKLTTRRPIACPIRTGSPGFRASSHVARPGSSSSTTVDPRWNRPISSPAAR